MNIWARQLPAAASPQLAHDVRQLRRCPGLDEGLQPRDIGYGSQPVEEGLVAGQAQLGQVVGPGCIARLPCMKWLERSLSEL